MLVKQKRWWTANTWHPSLITDYMFLSFLVLLIILLLPITITMPEHLMTFFWWWCNLVSDLAHIQSIDILIIYFRTKSLTWIQKSNTFSKSNTSRRFNLDFIEEDDGFETTGDTHNISSYSEETTSDDWLSVSVSQETVDLLRFYRNVVSPIIESYWLSAKHLFSLLDKPMEYEAFNYSLTDSAKDQLRQGLLCFREYFVFNRRCYSGIVTE